MKVVSKEQINIMNDESKVADKKHNRDLLNQANPKKPRFKPPKPSRPPRPPRAVRIADLQALGVAPSAPVYNEYRKSFKDSALKLVTSMESPEHQEGLAEKIVNSKDIQSIIVQSLPVFETENNLTTLVFTVLGKFLENRLGI